MEVRGIDCTCWFLDHGDEDSVPVEDLREIAPKFFLYLPLHVITVKLAGLEDYEYGETIIQHLNSFLLGKSLVAQVENRSLSEVTIPDLDLDPEWFYLIQALNLGTEYYI